MTDAMYNRYRPKTLSAIVGHDVAVRSVTDALKKGEHSFCFVGPSGVGKTTFARCIGAHFELWADQVVDISGATYSGVEAMREVTAAVETRGLAADGKRLLIVDECQALSKQAWQSLLKIVEEPPVHLYMVFCTTELEKVPKTIQTRCATYELRALSVQTLSVLLQTISGAEKIRLPFEADNDIVRAAQGSARQLITYLAMCRSCKTRVEVNDLLRTADESGDIPQLCKLLLAREPNWKALTKLLEQLGDQDPESVRIGVSNYLGAIARRESSIGRVLEVLDVMSAFSQPYNQPDKRSRLLLSCAEAMFQKAEK